MMSKFIFFSLITAFTFNAFAEGGQGGSADDGGHGVLCPKYFRATKESFTLEILDLYEARTMFGQNWGRPIMNFFPLDSRWRRPAYAAIELEKIRGKVRELVGKHPILNTIDIAIGMKHELQSEVLFESNDFGRLQVKLPKNCNIVQIALYNRDSNTIRIDADAASMLGDKDLIGLFLHEALHNYFKNKDSTLVVRQAVTYMLAKSDFQRRNLKAFVELITTQQPVRFI